MCRNLPVWIQRLVFSVTFFLLDIEGCDAILSAQWLKVLGLIIWDFTQLWMRFWHQGRAIELKRYAKPRNRIYGEGNLERVVRKHASSWLIRLCANEFKVSPIVEEQPKKVHTHNGHKEQQHQGMVKLLSEFEDLFMEPKGLPPTSSHDHVIPLEEGRGPVSVRPYR